MTDLKIHILTGPVHSGKTSRLLNWADSLQSVDGIAAPLINSSRYLQRISTNRKKLLQIPVNSAVLDTEKVGTYHFLKDVFAWGRKILLDCAAKNLDWLVVDEVGPLELNGSGLEPAVSEILNCADCSANNILLVVRDSLLSPVIEQYGFKKKEIVFFNLEGGD